VGWTSDVVVPVSDRFRVELRFNTLTRSASTGIDGLVDLRLIVPFDGMTNSDFVRSMTGPRSVVNALVRCVRRTRRRDAGPEGERAGRGRCGQRGRVAGPEASGGAAARAAVLADAELGRIAVRAAVRA
jgi:hypothetical protein